MAMASWLNGYDEMLKRFLFMFLFRVARMIYGTFQTIYWSLNGTLEQLHQSKLPEHYDKCVHVMNIAARYTCDVLKEIEREDFFLTHNRFESPEYIFKTDQVTLMTLNEEGAIFVEEPKDKQLWRSECNSFFRIAQFDQGIRLLFVPMHHFLRMSEELGDPKQHTVWVFNTARCGSTLFTQVMEMTDCCVALSEPDSLYSLSLWYRRDGDTPRNREILKASIRWLCRPFSYIERKATIIKVTAPVVVLLELVLKVYPDSKFLYMYREVEKSAKSLYRMAQELPLVKIAVNFSRYHGIFTEKMVNSLGFHGPDFRYKSIDDIDICIFVWAIFTREYVEKRKRGFPVSAIRYEDLVKNRKFAVEEILKYCGLPVELTGKALRGLEVDSQRNSPVSQKILALHKDPELTPRAEARAIQLLKSFGIPPDVRTPVLLEGTITCK